jgi:hypothetical protein
MRLLESVGETGDGGIAMQRYLDAHQGLQGGIRNAHYS